MTFKAPMVLGIQPAALPQKASEVETVLSSFGNNTGNLLFSEALMNVIKNAKSTSYHFKEEDLEDRDCVVIAAANWLNPYSDFGNLAERLKKTDLPIILVGVGAQSQDFQKVPSLKSGTLDLVKLASNRSNFISVRGDYSRWVLNEYGINNVLSTGCPSMLLNGPGIPSIKETFNFENNVVAFHGTRHLFNLCGFLDRYIYKQALEHSIDIILQSELADFYYSLDCVNDSNINKKCDDVHYNVYEISSNYVKQYLHNYGKIFGNTKEWVTYLQSKKNFCLGTRFHGTIAALLAGIPATLITHDTRTLEMAQKMNIPMVSAESIDLSASLSPQAYYDRNKIENFEKGFQSYYSEFMHFFSENEISILEEFQ